jgi:hypothetical protein
MKRTGPRLRETQPYAVARPRVGTIQGQRIPRAADSDPEALAALVRAAVIRELDRRRRQWERAGDTQYLDGPR